MFGRLINMVREVTSSFVVNTIRDGKNADRVDVAPSIARYPVNSGGYTVRDCNFTLSLTPYYHGEDRGVVNSVSIVNAPAGVSVTLEDDRIAMLHISKGSKIAECDITIHAVCEWSYGTSARPRTVLWNYDFLLHIQPYAVPDGRIDGIIVFEDGGSVSEILDDSCPDTILVRNLRTDDSPISLNLPPYSNASERTIKIYYESKREDARLDVKGHTNTGVPDSVIMRFSEDSLSVNPFSHIVTMGDGSRIAVLCASTYPKVSNYGVWLLLEQTYIYNYRMGTWNSYTYDDGTYTLNDDCAEYIVIPSTSSTTAVLPPLRYFQNQIIRIYFSVVNPTESTVLTVETSDGSEGIGIIGVYPPSPMPTTYNVKANWCVTLQGCDGYWGVLEYHKCIDD